MPLIRASEMRTMSRTPCLSRWSGMGSIPYSGIPGPPLGPALRKTSTLSAVMPNSGSLMVRCMVR
ncbi:hypothetical protein SALBM311S_01394 [Streptomyces alboniger]